MSPAEVAGFTRDAAEMVRANDAARVAWLAALMWPSMPRSASAMVAAVNR